MPPRSSPCVYPGVPCIAAIFVLLGGAAGAGGRLPRTMADDEDDALPVFGAPGALLLPVSGDADGGGVDPVELLGAGDGGLGWSEQAPPLPLTATPNREDNGPKEEVEVDDDGSADSSGSEDGGEAPARPRSARRSSSGRGTKKRPRKAGGSGSGGGGGSRARSAKARRVSSKSRRGEEAASDSDADYDDDTVYCLCRQPENGRPMVGCDGCDDWCVIVLRARVPRAVRWI
jgi:hypothetical protein